MRQIVRQTSRLLGLLFALALLLGSSPGLRQPAAQAASGGCTGAHCLFVPLVSVPGPIFVTSVSIESFKAYCFISARAVAENISAEPIATLSIEVELKYTVGVTTTTLSMDAPILLPGQRTVLDGMATCREGNDRPTVSRITAIRSSATPTTDYTALSIVSFSYNCGNDFGYGQQFTATVQNTSSTTIDQAQVFFDSAGRFSYHNTAQIDQPILAGENYTLTYRPSYYGDLGCTGPNNPPPTTVYAYGRVVQ